MFPDLPGVWYSTLDGDLVIRDMLNHHYSGIGYKDGRKPKLSAGPGFKMVLKTSDGLAGFIWRKFRDASNQGGVNCSMFQNNAPQKYLSSDLIKEACCYAWQRWPNERLYTYVDPGKVISRNPGYCFVKAGWRKLRDESGEPVLTKVNKLLIFEMYPEWAKD